jgi:hypothetical protein
MDPQFLPEDRRGRLDLRVWLRMPSQKCRRQGPASGTSEQMLCLTFGHRCRSSADHANGLNLECMVEKDLAVVSVVESAPCQRPRTWAAES